MTRISWAAGSSVLLTVLGLTPHPNISGMTPSARAESFTVKPGAWEMTHTTRLTEAPIPPSVISRMPPEQRAIIEQSMRAHTTQPKTHVSKDCVTQKDLDQNRLIKEAREEDAPQCTITVISKSSNKLVIEQTCPAPHASTSQIAMEAKTPESIEGRIDVVRAGSDKVHVDIKGRWLSASCAEIKNDK